MTTLIFSDTHLTDRFNPRKFAFLARIVGRADRVIINGDFWDGHMTSFEAFFASRWNKLFPLLKERGAIYLFGNHDEPESYDPRMGKFSAKQTVSTKLVWQNRELLVEHGNRLAPSLVDTFPWLPRHRLTGRISWGVEYVGLKVLADRFLTIEGFPFNRKIRTWAAKNLSADQLLVTGHTHLATYEPENRFINTGLIRHGYAQYLKVSSDTLELVTTRY